MKLIQKIFYSVKDSFDISSLSSKQRKVFNDILICRTEKMGFNSDVCENCGNTEIHYNSCKNSSCPICQSVKRYQWIVKESFYKLNIKYFHIVFTIPSELNPFVLLAPESMYSILFEAASQTILQLCADDKYLGAKPGFTAVLHTWGQNLSLHPHLHLIVSAGGITEKKLWKDSKPNLFFPVKVMSSLFKGKYLNMFKKNFDVSILDDPSQLDNVISLCYSKDWVVYTKEPMENPDHVIEYLARYTHRIAISNSRIVSFDNGTVTFRYKDYADGNEIKLMTLEAKEFVRRFLLHVLPKGFMKIRHFGFLSNSRKKQRFIYLRSITQTPTPDQSNFTLVKIISALLKRDITICTHCLQKRHPLRE